MDQSAKPISSEVRSLLRKAGRKKRPIIRSENSTMVAALSAELIATKWSDHEGAEHSSSE